MADLARLRAILGQEREALLAGRLDAAVALGPEKAAALDALAGEADRPSLREALALLRQSDRLLGRAREGARQGAARLAERREVARGFAVYDRNGGTSRIGREAPRTVTAPRPGKIA